MQLKTAVNAVAAGLGIGAALGQRLYKGYPNQLSLLSDFRKDSEWLLIILDACRYDFFDEVANEILDCSYHPVWSSGRNTFEYVRKAWPEYYPEVTYLSAAPVVNAKSRSEESDAALEMFQGYIASEHLPDIRELFKYDTAERIGTCPPELVTKKALEIQSEKMVAHYFQPHAPYIGEERLIMEEPEGESNTKLIWDAVRNGNLEVATVCQAYKDNLKRALHSVAKLIDLVTYENIVITADHGEALGEYRVLSHPNEIPYHPKIRVVPWAEVKSVKEYDEWDIDIDMARTDKTIEDRLSQLGYL